MKKLNFIDVFSGAGGLSCGLELAGMRCVLGVDHDKWAIETFKKNHKHAQTYLGDITKLTGKKLKDLLKGHEINAVVGGPPCQGFSTVGLGNPKDKRNNLFMQFVRIVKETNPEFIVIENVTGLVAKKNEACLKAIFSQFNKLGYYLDVKVLSAENFGVPEKRRRTIIIGSKITDAIVFPKHTHNRQSSKGFIPAVTVGEAFLDLKTKGGILHNHDLNFAKVKTDLDLKRLKHIPEGKGIRYERDEKAYLPKRLRLDVDWETIPEKRFRQTKYMRLDRNLPGPTIMTHRHGYYHPTEHRYLTQREAAKVQSFPNDFVFCGTISAQWRQIGNAVPPLLGKAIGKSIISMFKKSNLEKVQSKNSQRNKSKQIKQSIKEIREKAFHYR